MTEQPTHEQICEKCKLREPSYCGARCCFDCRVCEAPPRWCWKDASQYKQKADDEDVEEDVEGA